MPEAAACASVAADGAAGEGCEMSARSAGAGPDPTAGPRSAASILAFGQAMVAAQVVSAPTPLLGKAFDHDNMVLACVLNCIT